MGPARDFTADLTDEIRAIFLEGRTGYGFSAEKITDEQLADIYRLVEFAPTSINAQPIRVLWVRTPEAKEKLLPHVWDGNRVALAGAPATAILAVDMRFHEDLDTLYPPVPEVSASLEHDQPRREWIGPLSAHLQAGYMVLAARALGLLAGPMEGFDKDELDKVFFPDGRFRSFLLLNVGHAGERPYHDRNPRRDFDEVVSFA
jgi:3-hydroxypropanoate dehydrogenase